MGEFFWTLWCVYTGLLKFVGNTILVLLGVVMCCFAMQQQLQEIHSALLDTLLLGMGISLVAFSLVRRLVWHYVGLCIPWVLLVAGALYLIVQDHYRFDPLAVEVLALAFVPPAIGTLILEMLPKAEVEDREPHLEITTDVPLMSVDDEPT
jgi:hypothetical protein